MARFEAKVSPGPGRIVVTLTGECDLEGRDRFSALLLDAVSRAEVVEVDLAAVEFIDSSGIHALVTAHHAARETGRRLHVVHATGAVATVLDITGVGQLLAPCPQPGAETDHD
ncbi:STAS domain-containing protein [Actinoplanes sp. NPDC051859]|uniref:STAS domain-containing protein n=1 Tax=Actinoplanes sp. NPDC051859 TaxID=3363909 RepID=UPI00379F6991